MLSPFFHLFRILPSVFLLALGCGGAGEKFDDGESLGPYADIAGAISTQTGRQSAMAGWVVVLMDQETEISRVAEIDASGLFTLPHVFLNRKYTLALLSPDFVFTAMLSEASTTPSFIHQYFNFESAILPKLIYKSETLSFLNYDGIIIDKRMFTTDVDNNRIPDEIRQPVDAVAPVALNLTVKDQSFALNSEGQVGIIDQDQDGLPNHRDSDLDGLGIPNIFDSDDDNDTFPDSFEIGDANGDQIHDSLQAVSDQHFRKGVDWVGVIYEREEQADGSIVSYLTFGTKVSDEVQPNTVQVRGSNKLLNGAKLVQGDADWDRLLLDDGQNEDSYASDRIFGRKIRLAATSNPIGNQVLFFQLGYIEGEANWYQEFAYTIPNNVTLRALTHQFIAVAFQFQLIQDPYNIQTIPNEIGEAASYIWYVDVYNTEGKLLFTTPNQESPVTSYTMGADYLAKLESGVTYQYQLVVQSRARVTGYPAYVVKSKKTDFSVTKIEQ